MNGVLNLLSGLLVLASVASMVYCWKYTDDDSIAGTNYMLAAILFAVLAVAVKP